MSRTDTKRVVLSWSSGKDSAWALHVLRERGEVDVVALLTTVTEAHGRVAMHGSREALLQQQASAVGLPVVRVPLPSPCSNAVYEERMAAALAPLREQGVRHIAFGDLFLEEIRAYRDAQLLRWGWTGLYPLWGADTAELARHMVAAGLRARVVCLDPEQLDASFAGARWDEDFLKRLPDDVDPCGENGEFHTFVTEGPMLPAPIAVEVGETVTRDRFVFTDLLPA